MHGRKRTSENKEKEQRPRAKPGRNRGHREFKLAVKEKEFERGEQNDSKTRVK